MDLHLTPGLCVNPFVLVGTQCVHLLPTSVSWKNARTQCGRDGGDLIVLDDCEQYHKVYLYLAEESGIANTGFWIGGSDEAVEGQWYWIDGSPMVMGLPFWGNAATGKNPTSLEWRTAWS
ncbi:C-type lectin domain family 4 member E-like [Hyalella azteca]|uniref:C-type lectin domain family 4 member E-like n=1 Tax=Hyalella azteca TaxID=294128 RepID=A0A979FMU4_HYAAZ|nr:C-type lectin domain family 4 member E-like [Hyalella azteca]